MQNEKNHSIGLEELKTYKVTCQIPVQWAEMDVANHVNNVVFLRWVEAARIKYFEATQISNDFNSQAAPILAWQDCKYIATVHYPDTVEIGVKVVELLEDRFKMESKIFSLTHKRIVAISYQTIMAYDYILLKKTGLPESWVEGIMDLDVL